MAGKTRSTGKPPHQWVYRNLTPWRIEYRLPGDGYDRPPALTVPALGEVRVYSADAEFWDTSALRQRGQLEVVPAPADLFERLPSLVLLLGWLGVALTGVIARVTGSRHTVPFRGLTIAALVVGALALVAAVARELVHARRFRSYRIECRKPTKAGDPPSSTMALGDDHTDSASDGIAAQVHRWLAQTLVLVGSLLVAVIGPALAIYHATQLRQVLRFDPVKLVKLQDPFSSPRGAAGPSGAVWQLLVGHTAQWVLVSVAALVPALMYFQFDRERLAAVQGRWIRHVFRLDPTVRSLGDIKAKYGAHMEAAFGVRGPTSSSRLRRGRLSPVIIATILSTVGWVVIAVGTPVPRLTQDAQGAYQWPDGTFPVHRFFLPTGTALGFAVLGAYLFSVFHVVRGYHRRDLVPKSYNTIVVRYLAAYILTLAADAIVPKTSLNDSGLIAFAFFAGFVPKSALVWLRESVNAWLPTQRKQGLDDGAPLTELEGIDLYDRTRLAEEGVNNVHALAHADLVELMSATRIPADRLVDWTDQAILYLRVGGDCLDQGKDPTAETQANMAHLRRYGIRNASDLLQAYRAAVARGEAEAKATGATDANARLLVAREVDQLLTTLTTDTMPRDDTGYLAIQGMIDTLPDEEWFTQILNWRRSAFGRNDSWQLFVDGTTNGPRVVASITAAARRGEIEEPPSFPTTTLEIARTSTVTPHAGGPIIEAPDGGGTNGHRPAPAPTPTGQEDHR